MIPRLFTPPGDSGEARLQSRTYPGKAPAPAAGDMAYIYRVDLTAVQGATAANCVTTLALDFGPVVKMPYGPNSDSDMFVVTSAVGSRRSVEIASADQVGKTITFTFSKPVCPGATSYFFGLASKSDEHVAGTARRRLSVSAAARRREIASPEPASYLRPGHAPARGKMPCALALSFRRLFCILRTSAPRRM